MQLQGLWLVLAGFVLGFAISTLWEWLYYRRQRWLFTPRQSYPTRQGDDPEVSAFEEETLTVPTTDERIHAAYRSPGVFLESEQDGVDYEPETLGVALDPPIVGWAATQASAHQRRPQPGIPLPPLPLAVDEDLSVVAPLPDPAPALDLLDGPSAIITVADTLNRQTSDAGEREDRAQAAASGQAAELLASAPPDPALALTPASAKIAFDPPNQPMPQPEPLLPARRPTLQPDPERPAAPTPRPVIQPLYSGLGLRSSDYPDDLAKIYGIGEVYKQRLYAAGIYTWQQIADGDVESLRRITHAKPNADIGNWQVQARGLVQRFNRMGALYHGPPPDELTDIAGIGPTVRDALYRAGISTYAQLATTTATTLAQILPAPTIGTTYNFDDWIEEAARRAPPQV